MRLPTTSGLAMGTILAASLGFASLTQAAPLAGVAGAVPSVQMTQIPLTAEALPEKAYHSGYKHRCCRCKPVYKPPYHHPTYPKKEEYEQK
ncbi:MAG TPA: hypothetical protein VIH87_05285 [Methylocella sp.]